MQLAGVSDQTVLGFGFCAAVELEAEAGEVQVVVERTKAPRVHARVDGGAVRGDADGGHLLILNTYINSPGSLLRLPAGPGTAPHPRP